jgi:hypothetical protein
VILQCFLSTLHQDANAIARERLALQKEAREMKKIYSLAAQALLLGASALFVVLETAGAGHP